MQKDNQQNTTTISPGFTWPHIFEMGGDGSKQVEMNGVPSDPLRSVVANGGFLPGSQLKNMYNIVYVYIYIIYYSFIFLRYL